MADRVPKSMTSMRQERVLPTGREHRTLFLVQVKPYPLSGGVSLRNWQNINLLAQQGSVAIFSLYKGSSELASSKNGVINRKAFQSLLIKFL